MEIIEYNRRSSPKVCKVMAKNVDKLMPLFNHVDHLIVLIRDPRDFLVSSLFYRFNEPKIFNDDALIEKFIKLVELKIIKPDQVSYLNLYSCLSELDPTLPLTRLTKLQNKSIRFSRQSGFDFTILRYEDFVDGNAANFLDSFGKDNAGLTEGWTSKIRRSSSSGQWKNWFLPSDLEALKVPLSVNLERFKYTYEQPIKRPNIERASSIDYVYKLVNAARQDPMYFDSKDSDVYYNNLISASADNKKLALKRLALHSRSNENFSDKEIFQLLFRSALLGDLESFRLLFKWRNDYLNDRRLRLLASNYRLAAINGDDVYVNAMLQIGKLLNDDSIIMRWSRK
jgi:hypothetical protein